MALNLTSRYQAVSGQTEFSPEFWNGFIRDLVLILQDVHAQGTRGYRR